jgi:hypothetical protein
MRPRVYGAREAALDDAALEVAVEAVLDVPRQTEAVRRPRSGLRKHGLEARARGPRFNEFVACWPLPRQRSRIAR